jgi:hypothetical protein
MRRSLLINIVLVITGILLALALFGAGAVWKDQMQPRRPSVSAAPFRGSMPDRENVASPPAGLSGRQPQV